MKRIRLIALSALLLSLAACTAAERKQTLDTAATVVSIASDANAAFTKPLPKTTGK